MKSLILFSLLALGVTPAVASQKLTQLKQQIISTAKKYQGQGDPDFKIQNTIEPMVEQLLKIAPPQAPIKDRLAVLAGTWKQVWGPYDYRNDDRGVDPELGVNEIYQVVSIDGYYYNVSPQYPKGDKTKERIGLLRGEYTLSSSESNGLDVRFTKFTGVEGRPTDKIWTLAALSENGTLDNEFTVVPSLIVKLFFGSGTLIEVYTDKDLRILYGTGANFSEPYLYVMTRVK